MLRFCLCCLLIAVSFGGLGADYNPIECGQYEISCKNGQCIDKKLWCDNVEHCYDGSDERNCKGKDHGPKRKQCPLNFFGCNNGNCIPVIGRCDGYDTCGDFSDENNCSREIDTNSSSHTKNQSLIFEVLRPSLEVPPRVKSTNGFQDDVSNEDESQYDYFELDTSQFMQQEKRTREWLLSLRKEDYGWGDDTERAIIALSLSKNGLDANTPEELLMIKQLHLNLFVALARNETKMEQSDLALYINAIQASCGEARNFYGFDLVSKLRDRVNTEYKDRRYPMPFVYLTLCLNNASEARDAIVLQDMFLNRDIFEYKKDFQALVLLATICMKTRMNHEAKDYVQLKRKLVEKISNNLAGNVYEVALITQALNAAKVDPDTWKREEALEFLLGHQNSNGSFGDLLATYYVLPILSGKSLLSLGDHCVNLHSKDSTPIQVLGNEKNQFHIKYNLYFRNPTEISQTMFLSVAEGTTFYDMMRLAQERNRNYRFSLDEKNEVPSVYSIGGVPNDAERGIYWRLYVKKSKDHIYRLDMVAPNDDLKKKMLREGDEVIFWWKPIF